MMNREKIDQGIASDVSEMVGNRLRGKEKAFQIGLASLCMSIASAVHQFGDQMSYIEVIVLLNDLYYRGLPDGGRRQRKETLH